mmetsp:Transcript_39241/g.109165  ORF Transcript_39241/g.109165 Transcript_39241/m.109165 type:complete len:264 (-) Transcript_39241:7-798(-)
MAPDLHRSCAPQVPREPLGREPHASLVQRHHLTAVGVSGSSLKYAVVGRRHRARQRQYCPRGASEGSILSCGGSSAARKCCSWSTGSEPAGSCSAGSNSPSSKVLSWEFMERKDSAPSRSSDPAAGAPNGHARSSAGSPWHAGAAWASRAAYWLCLSGALSSSSGTVRSSGSTRHAGTAWVSRAITAPTTCWLSLSGASRSSGPAGVSSGPARSSAGGPRHAGAAWAPRRHGWSAAAPGGVAGHRASAWCRAWASAGSWSRAT